MARELAISSLQQLAFTDLTSCTLKEITVLKEILLLRLTGGGGSKEGARVSRQWVSSCDIDSWAELISR